MLVPIEITEIGRNQSDTYFKYTIKISNGASKTYNGAQKKGPIAFSNTGDAFGEQSDTLVHVFENGTVIGAIRFSSMTFATPKQFPVGYQFNVYYPKKKYSHPKDTKTIKDLLDNIVVACESFKEEGW